MRWWKHGNKLSLLYTSKCMQNIYTHTVYDRIKAGLKYTPDTARGLS